MQAYLISVVFVLAAVSPTFQSDDLYCEEPPTVQFATLEEPLEEYPVGAVVTYSCQFGYTTRGKSNTLECEATDARQNIQWSQPQFSCTPQSCGDPGYINNGRRIGSLFAFPNSVKYECNEGYKLKGLASRYCQASGSWSGKLPVCEEIKCPSPQNPENGFVTYTATDYGSELEYKCDKGFRLNTRETIFCTSDGQWSNTNVECIESVCDTPQKPEYGSVQITGSSNKLLAGTLALFSCDGNRIIDGPTTSKCLENGEWTFPPPRCLEPCKIPYLSNGIIGKYVRERYSRRRGFAQIPVGIKVQEDEVIYLRCSEGHEVSGTEKREQSVSCKFGKWSHELQCDPASCRNGPPSVQNAQAVALNPEHGGKVLYLCDADFKKIENETIVCDYGTWKGTLPICKDTRCFVDDLKFPGLLRGRKSVYRYGETFEIECDSQYEVSNPNRRELICEEGIWKGLLPPCVAASCRKPPPQIDHGQSDVSSTVHSSIVKYSCQDPYILNQNSQVQCLFGEWVGKPPKCEDSRCYLRNLQNSAYVDFEETDSVTFSGNKLYVTCKEGYSPKSERPFCSNGKWNGISASPCRENDCTIPILYYGDIKELKLGDYYWNWKKFRYDRQESYQKIPAGTVLSYGTSVTLYCHTHYSFQGTSIRNQKVTCFKGKWLPDPVCLPVGQRYIPPTTTRKPYTTASTTITERPRATTTKVTQAFVPSTQETPLEETYEIATSTTEKETSTINPLEAECYCEYPINDDILIAHADGNKLKFHDKVKNGSLVVFRCKHVGYHQLNGVQDIKCDDCQKWHSSEFPTCSEPKQGSAVIIFDNTLNVSAEGNLEARKGENVILMCVAVESNQYPYWSVPSENGVRVKKDRMERESFGDVLYVTHLEIKNAGIENEGLYGCAVENNTMNVINLLINDPDLRCPEFLDMDGMNIIYDMERRVKSRAIFSCTNPTLEINGEAILTCQRNGEWSNSVPQCTDIKCRELKGTDLLLISYTNDRKIGSKATFHCFAPAQRSGASFADCLKNGTWSTPTPNCRTPPCIVENIQSALPDNVVVDVDDGNKTVPYNTTVKLTCSEDMIVKGEPIAKCNRNGDWIVEKVQCVSGCPELATDPDSTLIITPSKKLYKLGDMVTFSCPPGMSLTTQSQLIMCLKYGWSDDILPDCQ